MCPVCQVGHLHVVAAQCDKNLMPEYNLAPLWGPNMLTVDTQDLVTWPGQTSGEMEVFQAVGNVSTLVRTYTNTSIEYILYRVRY